MTSDIDANVLSAYLDGELSPAELLVVEQAIEDSPELQDMVNILRSADAAAQITFEADLRDPVADSLVAAISDHTPAKPANEQSAPSGFSKLAVAACFGALLIGAVAGYVSNVSEPVEVAATRGWLDDIADYHRVYSRQVRHLVEVGAEEADHIETWLTNTVGTEVTVADLSDFGLEFQGARLLVAAGRPVAQLVYTDQEGAVVALCIIESETPREDFATQQRGEFEMVVWGGENANLVLVGDQGQAGLSDMARSIAF